MFTLTCTSIFLMTQTSLSEYLKANFNMLLMTKSVSGLQNTTIHELMKEMLTCTSKFNFTVTLYMSTRTTLTYLCMQCISFTNC